MGRPSISLGEDTRENGLREPIIVHEGKVLHGRHRLRACNELGIEPVAKEWTGECKTREAFIATKNLLRRHLIESQRSLIAAALATWGASRDATRKRRRKTKNAGLTDTQAAEAMQGSTRTDRQLNAQGGPAARLYGSWPAFAALEG